MQPMKRPMGWVVGYASLGLGLWMGLAGMGIGEAEGAPSVAVVDWSQLESPGYEAYLERLRAAGCPEHHVARIVRADAEEWLVQQRVAQAVASDFSWWKAEPPPAAGEAFNQERFQELRQRRDAFLRQYLGVDPEVETTQPDEVPVVINLSGPVLGALPREKYNAVQEVCARSMDRSQGYLNNRQNEGIFLNQGDLARLREQTRAELSVILTPEELEEFLLRYSHNAARLRSDLAKLEPTPEEFRAIFRAVDKVEHRMQLEFGARDSLSARQREELDRQIDEAIRGILPPDRYRRYMQSRSPLFGQAQLAVRRAGLPDNVVLPFFEVLSTHESRRREVLNNVTLSADQRQVALQGLERDKEAALQQALGEAGYRQYRESLVN